MPAPAAYVPYTLWIGDNQGLIIRTRSAPLALGAQRGDIIRLVLMPVTRIVASGIVVGLVLSLALNRALSSWTITRATNPAVFVVIALILIVVAAAAALIPARRAAAAAPIAALRSE